MRSIKKTIAILAVLAVTTFTSFTALGDTPPLLYSFGSPVSEFMQIIFYGAIGPFRVQTRDALTPSSPWVDVPNAIVMQLRPGVYQALVSGSPTTTNVFYRIVSANDPANELTGWMCLAGVSAPTNGTYFVTGERPVMTVNILDTLSQGLRTNDLSTLALYLAGPVETTSTVTASKLLNASTNRAVKPHHYVDLLKSGSGAVISGNIITYTLQPITTELPGTYTFGVRAILASNTIEQTYTLTDIQIKTPVAETEIVAKKDASGNPKCASCHEGTISGKMYMHHIDGSTTSPNGSWSLDYEPVRSCKLCHNNDGYAAVKDTNGVYISDTTVRRVHGLHMGEGLKYIANTNAVSGDFRDYTDILFPADVKDCTTCHLDNRWKTNPSRLACGTCHDNIWFGSASQTPAGMANHPGLPWFDDSSCSACHPSSGSIDPASLSWPIPALHAIAPARTNVISITMTPPTNGTYYVSGESPRVSLVFRDDLGVPFTNHTTQVITNTLSTASLFVYGPRSYALPVLTSTAKYGIDTKRASVTCVTNGPWAISNQTFRIAINGGAPQDIIIPGTSTLVSAAQFVAAVNPVISNASGAAAYVSGKKVMIKTLTRGANAKIAIYNNLVCTAMVWKASGVTLEPDVTVAAVSTPANDLRPVLDPLDFADPMVASTATNISYQLDNVAGLTPGTYNIYAYYNTITNRIAITNLTGIGHLTFQVGTATAEKKVASNCADCHSDEVFHLTSGPIHAEPFDTDYCNACHDQGHPGTGDLFKNQGGTSLNGWSGFGAMPISRRVHAVHYGNYLTHPEQIYANATTDTFGHIIFPMDVRNCTKCHSQTDTWKQQPSRMVCLACHDSDAAKAHGMLETYIMDPADPYGPLSIETCEICHGADRAYSADKVHSITKPYVPPYPRAPR